MSEDMADTVVSRAIVSEGEDGPGSGRAAPGGGTGRGGALDRASALVRTTWFLPALATAVLGLWRASSIEIWLDELTSVSVASRSWSQILHTVRHVDAVHGAYYLFLHLWITLFGHSLLVMRLPGVAAVTGAAICVALTGRRLFGDRAGFAAGAFFALTPAISRYATELRSYPFVAFAAALATFLFVRALENPSRRRWAGYAVALAAAGLLNLVAFTIVAGHVVGFVAYVYRNEEHWFLRARRFVVATVLATVAATPVVYYGMHQVQAQIGLAPKPTLHDVFTMGPQAVCSVLGAGILLAAGAAAWGDPRIRAVTLATATALLPVAAIWVISRVGSDSYFFFARYLLFCVPAWALLAGAGVAAIRSTRVVVAVLVVFGVCVVPDQQEVHTDFAHSWYNYPGLAFPPRDYRAAAQDVQRQYQPGDAGVFSNQIDIDEGINFYLPADEQLRDLFQLKTPAQVNNLFPVYCTDLQACLGDQSRVWMILPADLSDPFTGLLPSQQPTMRRDYRVVSVDHVTGLTVALLERG